MHDLKWIRENAEGFDAGLARRGLEPQSAAILALDEERRAVVTRLQEAQARRNAASKEIGRAKGKGGDPALADSLMAEVASLKDALAAGEADEKRLDEELRAALSVIPNIPADDVPQGADEKANVLLRSVGEPRKFDFEPKQHFDLGEALGLMDFEAAAKMSGARFVVLKGALARMERALAALMLDLHTGPVVGQFGGYQEVNPPLLVKDDAMFGTGQLPKFEDDLFKTEFFDKEAFRYHVERYGIIADQTHPFAIFNAFFEEQARKRSEKVYFLVPTAEVSLTNLVRESILVETELPMRLTAHTPCFRAEAGAAGRDTRGMIRQHQFSKVELVSIAAPEQSEAEHERMTASAEEVLRRLELPFRTMLLCTGDMGFSARKTYDIEVWLPGQNAYREISSCSNCGDFQARRMNARYRPAASGEKGGAKDARFVHTLNGSGLAVGRTLVAVLENYQQADGSIRVPDALKPYMGGLETISTT